MLYLNIVTYAYTDMGLPALYLCIIIIVIIIIIIIIITIIIIVVVVQ